MTDDDDDDLHVLHAKVAVVDIATAASLISVSPRTVRMWAAEESHPLPVIKQKGRPMLIYMPCMMLWLAAHRRQGNRRY